MLEKNPKLKMVMNLNSFNNVDQWIVLIMYDSKISVPKMLQTNSWNTSAKGLKSLLKPIFP